MRVIQKWKETQHKGRNEYQETQRMRWFISVEMVQDNSHHLYNAKFHGGYSIVFVIWTFTTLCIQIYRGFSIIKDKVYNLVFGWGFYDLKIP